MKINKSYLLILALSALSPAQNKKFTMEDAVLGLRSNLAVKSIYGLDWAKNQEGYIQQVKNAYTITQYPSMKMDTLVSLHQINQNLSKERQLKGFPRLTFINDEKAYFDQNNTYYLVEKQAGAWQIKIWEQLPEDAENIQITDNGTFLFTVKNNLYSQYLGKKTAITQEQNENIISGQSVHRNEFGIHGGIFPAPDQNKVAFYKMDQTMVKDYPIIDWSVVPAENHNIKYPMAGGTSHQVCLGIYDFKTQQTQFLQIDGDPEQYLTAVSWSPDARFIFVGVLNRDQNHLKMNQYDAQTGRFIKTLFEEKNAKYVEPEHPLLFLPHSNQDFIWQSQRSGFNHLYHYHIDRGLVQQITTGDWLVTDVLGFNAAKHEIYINTTKNSPLERQVYKVNWKNKKLTPITSASGMHRGLLNQNGTLLIDTYSNAEVPRNINLINTQNLKSQPLFSAENPLKDYARPEVKNVTLKADDGTPLYGKLILPTDFNPNQKYPVIVYLYGGPHAQLITNTFPASGNLWYEYLAQRGYVVFSMDNRGSSNRGFKFESAPFRQLGTVEMEDQLKGVAYLKSLPYVDADRMGVHGWSFGGFMTTSLMLRHPEVFKVAVAGGPVIDWNMYEIMYTERYMDSPQQNPKGYAQANLLDKIQNLKGKLLLIHGTQDDVVVWQHTINLLRNAVEQGTQLDYFVYPGHAHNVLGKDRVHLMQKVTDYFDLYLKDKK